MRALLMIVIGSVTLAAQTAGPQVTSQDLLDGLKDPTRWLTYGGDYSGTPAQPADADHAGERQSAVGAVDVPDRHARQLSDHPRSSPTA